jgi:hypothetical protein
MLDDDTKLYCVTQVQGRFEIQDDAERCIVVCRDERSATDYAVLLNEAYRRGFKAGYRQAKQL